MAGNITRVIDQHLTSAWVATHSSNLSLLDDYLRGDHPTTMLTAKQRNDKKYGRFWAPVNICKVIVDEPIGYLTTGSLTIETEDPEVQAWAEKFYENRLRSRLGDAIRFSGTFGECYWYLWTDFEGLLRGLKARTLAPIEGGQMRVLADYGGDDDEELTAAQIRRTIPLDTTGKVKRLLVTLTRDRIVVQETDENWHPMVTLKDDVNTAGVIPLIPFQNAGASDLLDIIPLQDDLNKLYFDLRQAREYHGFPMLAGPNNSSGTPEIGPGMYINGDVKRIEPGDLSKIMESEKGILERAAMLSGSLALNDRGTGNPSGVALRYLQQTLESKLQSKSERAGAAISVSLQTAARMLAVSPQLLALENQNFRLEVAAQKLLVAEFNCKLEPNIPADEMAQAQRATLLHDKGLASRSTAISMAGISKPEQEIEEIDKERLQRAKEAAAMFGGGDDDDDDEDGNEAPAQPPVQENNE